MFYFQPFGWGEEIIESTNISKIVSIVMPTYQLLDTSRYHLCGISSLTYNRNSVNFSKFRGLSGLPVTIHLRKFVGFAT